MPAGQYNVCACNGSCAASAHLPVLHIPGLRSSSAPAPSGGADEALPGCADGAPANLLASSTHPTLLPPLLQTLCVLYNCGESEMSTILFWQYLASVLTLPALMRVFLAIIDSNVQPP